MYAERGELTALQIAVTLWAKSDWGKKELRERMEEMCGDFLGALARLLDPLDDQRVGGWLDGWRLLVNMGSMHG